METAYYRKCIELRRRISDIEENNDATRLRMKRLNRAILKMRLERALLLEQIHKRMEYNIDDSDRSTSPPPTPTDKPLRSKRSHRQKTPPPGTQMGGGITGAQQPSPGSVQHQSLLHTMNPMSSAQTTPDPSRAVPFFSNLPPASSPYANGGSVPALPPLHSSHLAGGPLPQITPEPSRSAYYDPTHDDQRPTENGSEYSGRNRAHSSAHAAASEPRDAQNGDRRDQDTEMGDAPGGGFASINR